VFGHPEEKECHEYVTQILPLENGCHVLVFFEAVLQRAGGSAFTSAIQECFIKLPIGTPMGIKLVACTCQDKREALLASR